jgi:hypothetical protein
MLDEFVAVSIRKYRYPMVHVLILRTKSVFARSFCSDFTQPETVTLYHESFLLYITSDFARFRKVLLPQERKRDRLI